MELLKSASGLKPDRNRVSAARVLARLLLLMPGLLIFAPAMGQHAGSATPKSASKIHAPANASHRARIPAGLDPRLGEVLRRQVALEESPVSLAPARAQASITVSETPGSAREERSTVQRASWSPAVDDQTQAIFSSGLQPTPELLSENVQPTNFESTSTESSAGVESSLSEGKADDAAAATSSMFLDLRYDGPSTTTQPVPIAERGAEVSIETGPVQVLTRAVAWIVIALCLFSLAALGVRRWQRQRGLLPTSSTRSRVLETLSLGPGRSVSLIEMAGYRAFVAFDAGGIKQLVLTPPTFQDEFAETNQQMTYEPPVRVKLADESWNDDQNSTTNL